VGKDCLQSLLGQSVLAIAVHLERLCARRAQKGFSCEDVPFDFDWVGCSDAVTPDAVDRCLAQYIRNGQSKHCTQTLFDISTDAAHISGLPHSNFVTLSTPQVSPHRAPINHSKGVHMHIFLTPKGPNNMHMHHPNIN
jgi:hypothetical protein